MWWCTRTTHSVCSKYSVRGRNIWLWRSWHSFVPLFCTPLPVWRICQQRGLGSITLDTECRTSKWQVCLFFLCTSTKKHTKRGRRKREINHPVIVKPHQKSKNRTPSHQSVRSNSSNGRYYFCRQQALYANKQIIRWSNDQYLLTFQITTHSEKRTCYDSLLTCSWMMITMHSETV